MNSDSSVSADKSATDAEGAPEQSHSAPTETAPTGSTVPESQDSASGNEQVSSDAGVSHASDPPEAPAAAGPAPGTERVPDEPESSGVPAAAADAVAAVGGGESAPAREPDTGSVAAEAPGPDATAPGQEDPAAASPDETSASETDSAPESETAAAAKKKLRLNPTFDAGGAKAVPSLGDSRPSPPGEQGAETGSSPTLETADSAEAEETPAAAVPPTPPAVPVELPANDDLDAQMEAEIAAALKSGEIGDASDAPTAEVEQAAEEASEESVPPTEEDLVDGAKLSGVIQSIHEDNVFIDFGLRQSGVVSKRQFGSKKEPIVGTKIEIVVSKVDDDEGLILCSLPRGAARISGDWNSVNVGQTVECMVTKTNKGGLEVSVSSLRGFMPASQVDLAYVSDLDSFVGQKLTARVTEVNPRRRRLVVSRRSLLEEERAELEAEMLGRLEVGQTLTGRVKTIKDYGAFVDLGGMDGFLHIGQMSWIRIEHPSELLTEGQDVEVKILTIEPDKKDPEKKRIGLGMRQLVANPWANVEDKFPKGSTQSGKVTRTEAYGAFIELEPGIEGLAHISELDHRRVKRVTEVLSVGQQIEVQVLEVEPKRKRISLSVKALTAPPEGVAGSASDEDLAPGGGQPYERKRMENLKGGTGGTAPGGLFGDPSDFS